MIRIRRPKAPAFLVDPEGVWADEIRRATEHYKDKDAKAFKFELYNDPRVKDALKEVFVKCAYCESTYGAVYDGDVEHFRPKGKVKEKDPPTPGYYWLANDWDNLFLACQHCNQRRRHVLVGETELEGYGKMDQFPLDPETSRAAKANADVKKEEKARLLINPCKDKPEEHFEYERENAVMIPLSKKGETSIKVYVLQRPNLVHERKKQMLKLFKQMAIAKHALEEYNKNPDDAAKKNGFEMTLDAVMEFTSATEVYAGMSRYFVKKFLQENGLA
jgi:5-methylcytosine-specific restriction endonuclease McrA